jgi:hypothetical protein
MIGNWQNRIQGDAFSGWTALEYIDLGMSPQSIVTTALANTHALRSLYLPDTMIDLGDGIISGSAVVTLSLPASLATKHSNAFGGTSLQTVHLRGVVNASRCAILAGLPNAIWVDYISGLTNGSVICDSVTVLVIAAPTPRPAATLHPHLNVELADQLILAPNETSETEGLVVRGSGVVECELDDEPVPLRLVEIKVMDDSHVIAKRLVIEASISLGVGSSLAPPSGEFIELADGLSIVLAGDNPARLPVLDLGFVGDNYVIVPSKVELIIPENATSEEPIHRVIVRGKTLKNCEQWKNAISGLPGWLIAKCEVIEKAGAHLLADEGEEIGLFVANPPPTDAFTKSLAYFRRRRTIRLTYGLFVFFLA